MRKFIKPAGLLAATLLALGLPGAPAKAAEVVKIGLILSYSGQGAELGDIMDKAVRLYMKQHEAELGDTKIELVRRDDTGPNPEVARRLAQELIVREKVSLLAGLVFTPNANAIAPLLTESKVPLVIMNATGAATLTMSPYIVRTSFTKWQQVYPFGQWAAKRGIKNVYTAVSDFIPGNESLAAFTKGFTEGGGTIVGGVKMPMNTRDFIPFLQRVKDAKPEALFAFVPGGKDATALIKAYVELDFAGAGIKLIGSSDLLPDDELPHMTGVPEGIETIGPYSVAADRPANKALLAAWRQEYGPDSVPDCYAMGAWDGMAAIFHAVKEQHGKLDPDRTMALLKGWTSESPRGPIAIDPDTRNIVQNMYIRRLQRVDGKLANVETETISQVKDPWYQYGRQN